MCLHINSIFHCFHVFLLLYNGGLFNSQWLSTCQGHFISRFNLCSIQLFLLLARIGQEQILFKFKKHTILYRIFFINIFFSKVSFSTININSKSALQFSMYTIVFFFTYSSKKFPWGRFTLALPKFNQMAFHV